VSPGSGASVIERTGWPGRSSRGVGIRVLIASQSSSTARSAPMIIRACPATAYPANAAQSSPEGTTFAPM
jgi:hypothetical protein